MPDQGSERTGVLVIRAWVSAEQRGLIARITSRLDVQKQAETSQTVVGAEAVTRIAGEWLSAFERADELD